MAGFPPVFVCLTPDINIVTRYILQRHAPRKLLRTHAGRIGDKDPSRTLAQVMATFRTSPPDECRVQ